MSLPKNIFSRMKGKSFEAIAFRASQEAALALMSVSGGWRRLDRKIGKHWTKERAEQYLAKGFRGVLIDEKAMEGFNRAFKEGLLDLENLQADGAAIRARDFKIFFHDIPREGDYPWNTDWRHAHDFPLLDFRRYHHHAARDVAYDVKYPWELSRLSFLLPLMQKAMLEKGFLSLGPVEEVFTILADFDKNNPYAHSVNWQPMEVSMRGITLVMLLEMAILGRVSSDKIALLLKMITKHGEFLWRTIEYTDNRGNHYAANIVALLVMGAALSGHYLPCLKWQLYASEHIEEEIIAQFLSDGVNFEKSTAYHGLVAELFLVAMTVMKRQGVRLGVEAERRLHEACLFTATVRRPDGLIPLIGDTDDARLLAFDSASPRDPTTLLTLAAAMFDDVELKGALQKQHISPALPWILGVSGVERFIQLGSAPFSGGRHFHDGGYMVVRQDGSYIIIDTGEVGQNGVGGHGHNDILGFELGFEGHPLLVDPGCPTYTGDPRTRKLFRSTAWHNALVADNTEVAEILGPFRIAGHAKPHSDSFAAKDGEFILQGGHEGYKRLSSPLDHVRQIVFHPAQRHMRCTDMLRTKGRHRVDRYFHFAAGVNLRQIEGGIIATLHQYRFAVTFDEYSDTEILEGRVSDGYGHVTDAPMLKVSTEITGDVSLFAQIAKI